MTKELEVLELGRKIQSEAVGEMEKMQREFYLREQMKAIQKELGESDEQEAEIKELEDRIAEAGMPEEADKEARRELDRMRKMPAQAAEYSVIKTYLDWMVSLPWQKKVGGQPRYRPTPVRYWMKTTMAWTRSRDRILEYLAVRKLKAGTQRATTWKRFRTLTRSGAKARSVIICFVGPARRRQDFLGLSIARAMNRKFVRLALGGIRDEAEIRGFRRTYIGSMPGRVIQKPAARGEQQPGIHAGRGGQAGSRFPRRSQSRRCWKCWTRSRTAKFRAITIWTCPST